MCVHCAGLFLIETLEQFSRARKSGLQRWFCAKIGKRTVKGKDQKKKNNKVKKKIGEEQKIQVEGMMIR